MPDFRKTGVFTRLLKKSSFRQFMYSKYPSTISTILPNCHIKYVIKEALNSYALLLGYIAN